MLNKVFLISEFGAPFEWTQKYIDNVAKLEPFGWKWKIFTPNKYVDVPKNVEIVDMTIEQYTELVEKKLGVKPNMFITEKGVPSVHVTDFYPFSGVIFEDYIKDADFWGITNMDVVYGRLDHFLPDSALEDCDVFTDDVATINGVFSLYRNNEMVNNMFRHVPEWQKVLESIPCKKCVEGGETTHTLYGFDEYTMTQVMRMLVEKTDIRYKFPPYYPVHSHDRLENHVPDIKLEFQADGSLWELYKDMKSPNWIHARPQIGREVFYFHFCDTKKWPNIALSAQASSQVPSKEN